MQGKVYIASSLKNAQRVQHFRDRFRALGVEITYDWTVHGFVDTEEELKKYGIGERDGVLNADVLFFVQPGRFGAHVELGIATAMNSLGHEIPIVILEEVDNIEPKTFYYLENVHRFKEEDPAFEFAIQHLRNKYDNQQDRD